MVTQYSKPNFGALRNLSSVGALFGGILASSCCILPLILGGIGLGGAWLGHLESLAPYQPYFLTLAAISIGGGLWVSRKSRCSPAGVCADSRSNKRAMIGLGLGAFFAVGTVAFNIFYALF
ncbi:MAG: hypothetical protein JKY17_05515 [Magnetovibrio sp.]|nr:hypothetical protein [Magnetovibrio sp.]